MSMIKILVIPANGIPYATELDPTLDKLKPIVGGWLEGLNLDHCYMYINEEGKLLNLPRNEMANRVIAFMGVQMMPGDYIVGDAVLIGPPDEEGNETSIDEHLLEAVLKICV